MNETMNGMEKKRENTRQLAWLSSVYKQFHMEQEHTEWGERSNRI